MDTSRLKTVSSGDRTRGGLNGTPEICGEICESCPRRAGLYDAIHRTGLQFRAAGAAKLEGVPVRCAPLACAEIVIAPPRLREQQLALIRRCDRRDRSGVRRRIYPGDARCDAFCMASTPCLLRRSEEIVARIELNSLGCIVPGTGRLDPRTRVSRMFAAVKPTRADRHLPSREPELKPSAARRDDVPVFHRHRRRKRVAGGAGGCALRSVRSIWFRILSCECRCRRRLIGRKRVQQARSRGRRSC